MRSRAPPGRPQMDPSEALAFRYLESLNLGEVVHEPDGNVPPDFLVDGRIAVEVRRLNQNSAVAIDRPEGLEELAIPLSQRFRKLLQQQGPSVAGECWYVGYGFRRPLEPWSYLRPLLEEQLHLFKHSTDRTRRKVKVTKRLNIDFFPAGIDHGQFFVLGTYMDEDSGGWVMAELDRNLRLCIAQKEAKIHSYRPNYAEWWLVLADYIDYAIDYEDRDRFRSEVVLNRPGFRGGSNSGEWSHEEVPEVFP